MEEENNLQLRVWHTTKYQRCTQNWGKKVKKLKEILNTIFSYFTLIWHNMNNYNIDKKISQIHLSTTAIIHITEHCVDEYDSYTMKRQLMYLLYFRKSLYNSINSFASIDFWHDVINGAWYNWLSSVFCDYVIHKTGKKLKSLFLFINNSITDLYCRPPLAPVCWWKYTNMALY